MAATNTPQMATGLLSLADLNFFLINKLVVLAVVLLFFVSVVVMRRLQGREFPPSAGAPIKLALLGLLLLYFEATLTGLTNYKALLANIQSVIVLICLAKLLIYLIVDVALSLRRHGDIPMLLRDAIRLGVYLAAAIASMRLLFNVDLSAVITTTTVLTAAVAFAMQNTLANVFYGFNVQIDPKMARGNWISLPEKSLYGQIENVGFRYITIRTLDNNQVLVPNSMVVQSIVTTHGNVSDIPQDRAALTITIGLPYELPPEQARMILMGVLMEDNLVLKDPPSVVRLQTLGDSSIVYLLKFWLADPQQRTIAIDSVQTKAWYAIYRAGWSFPYPHRQIVTSEPRSSFPPLRQAVLDGLRHSHLFDLLSDEEMACLADRAHLRVYAPGESAVMQGEPGSSLFLLLDGEMSVELDGNEVARLSRGRVFGEMSLLTGAPRSATVRAKGEVRLAEVMKDDIAFLMERNERLLEKLSEALERHEAGLREHQSSLSPISGPRPVSAADYLRRVRAFFMGDGNND